MKTVVKWPNQILTSIAKEVEKVDDEVNKIMNDMLNVMLSNNGIGLAAPQISISKRIIVANVDRDQLIILVNPEIIKKSGEQYEVEGCLSIPGGMVKIKRAKEITVKGLDREGKEIEYDFTDQDAAVIQHEVDHLNGKTILQRANLLEKNKLQKQIKDWSRHVKRKQKMSVCKPQKSSRTRRSTLKRS